MSNLLFNLVFAVERQSEPQDDTELVKQLRRAAEQLWRCSEAGTLRVNRSLARRIKRGHG